jgi:purine-binding chemotaxis protein CheW
MSYKEDNIMSIPNNILSVKIGGELFAFDGEEIEQILRVPDITVMPLTSSGIKGVSSISGRTVTIVDMGIILSNTHINETQKDARVLTVSCDGIEYGILVDEVLEMVAVKESNYEVSSKEDGKISAIYKRDNVIIQIIDACIAINSLSLVSYQPVEIDHYDDDDQDRNNEVATDQSDANRCIFLTLGEEQFAISLEIAREIIFIPQTITPISEAGAGVMGMITLRDDLIVALDLKKIISIPPKQDIPDEEIKENRLLILNYEGKSIALLVDSISEVKDIPLNDTEKLPERFADSKIESIYKTKGDIVSIIATKYLIDITDEYTIQDEENHQDTSGEDDKKNKESKEMSEIAAFQINNEEFALDIDDVQEIIKYTEITPIPEAPQFIDGVINLRGVVIPIVSLPERLGFTKEIKPKSKILICDIKGEKIGLFVDDVNEIMFIEDRFVSKSSNENTLFSEVITLDEGKRVILKLRITEVLDDDTIDSIKTIES